MLQGKKVLITGGAGFIGSNLVDQCIHEGASLIRVLDNLYSGKLSNLTFLTSNDNYISKPINSKTHFEFIKGDIRDKDICHQVCLDIDIVFHLAAFVSVPLSVTDPVLNNDVNITGFLTILKASIDNQVPKFIYASSASVYGNNPMSPKHEFMHRNYASPYALSKGVDEDYADLYNNLQKTTRCMGLRFFNVYGPRQDPNSPYSGVLSRFADRIQKGESVIVYGDGKQCRDFVHVYDVCQALILASVKDTYFSVLNVGTSKETSILDLISTIQSIIKKPVEIEFRKSRDGDVRTSVANIHRIRSEIGYNPKMDILEGIKTILKSCLD